MKKTIIFGLVFALLLSMAGCGCKHTPGVPQVTSVDTETLTLTYDLPCSLCGEIMETAESCTGIVPADGVMLLSPGDWFACLTTNILTYGAGQMLMPVEADPQDDALLLSVVNLSGLKTVMSFYDKEGNVLTTGQKTTGAIVESIKMEAQFSNETAPHFYLLLALIAITNNSDLESEAASQLAGRIMDGEAVSDNGYLYEFGIVSVEDHTVMLTITAEA